MKNQLLSGNIKVKNREGKLGPISPVISPSVRQATPEEAGFSS
jgi:hypothetical protein